MTTVVMSDLEKSFSAPSASTSVEVVATVTIAPPPPSPIKLTAEEIKANNERWENGQGKKQWEKVGKDLTAAIADLVKEGKPLLKEEQRKADLKTFADASYALAQEAFNKVIDAKKAKEGAVAQIQLENAQREAAVRAKKLHQAANREERAQANRDRANGGTSGKSGNGNGKNGGKGK